MDWVLTFMIIITFIIIGVSVYFIVTMNKDNQINNVVTSDKQTSSQSPQVSFPPLSTLLPSTPSPQIITTLPTTPLTTSLPTPIKQKPELGIAQSNLTTQWRLPPGKTSQEMVDDIANIGAKWIRLVTLDLKDIPDITSICKYINTKGLKILLNINTSADDYDDGYSNNNTGSTFQQTCGWSQGSLQTSRINLSKYKDRITSYLNSFNNHTVVIDAFEILNEQDWVCFNGDLDMTKPNNTSNLSAFKQKYADIIQVSYQVIKPVYPNSKIISGGMSNCYPYNGNGCLIDPINLLTNWKTSDGQDVNQYLDGYGTHIYNSSSVNIMNKLNYYKVLNKPIWITEFGVAVIDQNISSNISNQLNTFINSGIPLGPMFFYTYFDSTNYSLYNSTTGKIADYASFIKTYNQTT